MPCYHPNPARELAPGRFKFKCHPRYATHWLDCQTCLGCREKQALTWTIRLKHESRCHSHSTFLTLTYDEPNLPDGLQIPDMQRFWKRLRKALPNKIKTFYCGEYGPTTHRPHYHAAVFGMPPFPDERKWDMDSNTSDTLNQLWGKGIATTSELTPDRMAYVAGYVMKKAGYKKQRYLAAGEDGIAVELQPPFRRMSQGLGKEWLAKYADDLREGCVHHDGFRAAIPRYYTDRIEKYDPDFAAYIKSNKDAQRQKMSAPDRDRLDAAEAIRHQQIKRAKRNKL